MLDAERFSPSSYPYPSPTPWCRPGLARWARVLFWLCAPLLLLQLPLILALALAQVQVQAQAQARQWFALYRPLGAPGLHEDAMEKTSQSCGRSSQPVPFTPFSGPGRGW